MKLITFFNYDQDTEIKNIVTSLLFKISNKYRIPAEIVNTGINKVIPQINEIRLFIFIHPPSSIKAFLKKLLRVLKMKERYTVVCIVGTCYKYAFPGNFSITRFCENCMGLVEYYFTNNRYQPTMCNCNHGPIVTIYPSEDDYFLLS